MKSPHLIQETSPYKGQVKGTIRPQSTIAKKFQRGDRVIFIPTGEQFDFGYIGQTIKAIIYKVGEKNLQDACAVDTSNLRLASKKEKDE